MEISAWRAGTADLDLLTELYRDMEEEQVDLKPVWALADGLPEPVAAALKDAVEDDRTSVYLGGIDGVPLGFAITRSVDMLPQADGERVGTVDYIYTVPEARGVGVGAAMMDLAMADLRAAGHLRFDAFALPGHRRAKNFFEANGFSARRIVMHHQDAVRDEDRMGE